MSSEEEPRRPVLRVIRGDATPEEIAALLAVVTARSGEPQAPTGPAVRPAWNDRSALMGRPHLPGPGAWRASAWQR